jgi:hypothetical protein
MIRPSPDTCVGETGGPAPTDAHLPPDLLDLLAVLSLNGEPIDQAPDPEIDVRHLASCGVCRATLDTRVAALRLERDAVDALVEASFSDSALDTQRRGIFARLTARRDNGRVLEFPARAGRPARRDRPAMRWLAAAAAAGLFVGMLAGPRLQPVLQGPFVGPRHVVARATPLQPVSAREPRVVHTHDELFLSEMETAVNNRGALPLRALDDLTPEPVPVSVSSPR